MSVAIVQKPYQWTFAGNRNTVRIHCLNHTTAGSVCSFNFVMAGLAATGNRIAVTVDGLRLRFAITDHSTTDAYSISSIGEFYSKLQSNHYIGSLFAWSINTSPLSSSIGMTGAQPGRHTVTMEYETADGDPLTPGGGVRLVRGTCDEGSDPATLENYRIALCLQIKVNNHNSVTQHQTPLLFLEPDADGYAETTLDQLADYLPQPDMPRFTETAATWFLLTNAFVAYRIGIGEAYGETPLVQSLAWTSWQQALRGELQDYYHRLNMPDWNDNDAVLPLSSPTAPRLRIVGEDDGIRRDLFANQPEYLYGFLYNTVTTQPPTFTLRIVGDNSGTRTVALSGLQNGNLFCIPVGPVATGCTADNVYTVALLYGSDVQFSRTYTVRPPARDSHHFLMQNKYGLMVSVYAVRMQRKQQCDSENVTADSRRYRHVTDRRQLFTATTPPMRTAEAARLASCFASDFHYYYAARGWQRIVLDGGDILYSDDGQDMATVEFSFSFCENQIENIATNNLRSSSNTHFVETNTTDPEGHYISFSVRTNYTSNAIYNE